MRCISFCESASIAKALIPLKGGLKRVQLRWVSPKSDLVIPDLTEIPILKNFRSIGFLRNDTKMTFYDALLIAELTTWNFSPTLFVCEGVVMSKVSENIPDCTIFLLAKAYQKAHGQFKAKLRPFNLTNLQHLVLEGLWHEQGVTAADLGKLLVLDKATLSGVLERMIASQWIKKELDPDDGRIFRIFTTEKADMLKERLIELRVAANEEMLADFSQEEKMLFKRLLRELT
jgi:DNA-binding MarR family transcriptional regulator